MFATILADAVKVEEALAAAGVSPKTIAAFALKITQDLLNGASWSTVLADIASVLGVVVP